MAYRTIQKRGERTAVLACVFAIHASLLLLVVLAGTKSGQSPPPSVGTLSVVSLTAEAPASTPPPPPTLPSKIVETAPLSDSLPAIETDVDSTTAASGGCKILEAVSAALVADPVAFAAVLAAPPETRSVADAIVLWNAGWSPVAATTEGPLSAVRKAVETSLRGIEGSCLDEEVAGPRLIPVRTGERTTFVVIGSGKWSWRELLMSDDRLALDRPISTALTVAPQQMP